MRHVVFRFAGQRACLAAHALVQIDDHAPSSHLLPHALRILTLVLKKEGCPLSSSYSVPITSLGLHPIPSANSPEAKCPWPVAIATTPGRMPFTTLASPSISP